MFNSRRPSPDELPSTRRLLRSTARAAGVAVVILFAVVLPAEYAVDPTGVGRLLGLTQIGEIKMQLAQEAAMGDPAAAGAASGAPAPASPAVATSAVATPATKAPAARRRCARARRSPIDGRPTADA